MAVVAAGWDEVAARSCWGQPRHSRARITNASSQIFSLLGITSKFDLAGEPNELEPNSSQEPTTKPWPSNSPNSHKARHNPNYKVPAAACVCVASRRMGHCPLLLSFHGSRHAYALLLPFPYHSAWSASARLQLFVVAIVFPFPFTSSARASLVFLMPSN